MMARLVARMRGMVSRAVVGLVMDGAKLQGLQVTILADQSADEVEHFQHYGFTSVPRPGAEGIALAVGGSRAHTVVINVDDRRFRLKNLRPGEVALYDDQEQAIILTRDGIVIDGAGLPVTIKNTTKIRMEADLESTGNIKDNCDSAGGRTMAQMRTSHLGHTHNGGDITSTPIQPI